MLQEVIRKVNKTMTKTRIKQQQRRLERVRILLEQVEYYQEDGIAPNHDLPNALTSVNNLQIAYNNALFRASKKYDDQK